MRMPLSEDRQGAFMDWLRAQALMDVPEANDALLIYDFLSAYARMLQGIQAEAVAAWQAYVASELLPGQGAGVTTMSAAHARLEHAMHSLAATEERTTV